MTPTKPWLATRPALFPANERKSRAPGRALPTHGQLAAATCGRFLILCTSLSVLRLEKPLVAEGCANWQELAAKRARANSPGAIPNHENLTFEERRAAQDRKD
jgi:hypothetical protein